MKLTVLIVLSLVWGAVLFLTHNILPEKTDKTLFHIFWFVSFMIILFAGVIGIYKLGAFWEMETQVKTVLGAVSGILLGLSIIYSRVFSRNQ